MADGYVGDTFIECHHYTVLEQYLLDDQWPDDDTTMYCYCGEEAPYRAKVAFRGKIRDDEEYGWGNSIAMEYTVDRCEDHKFEDDT